MGCQAKGQTHHPTRLAQTHTWLRTTLLLGDTLNVPKRPVPACWHLPGAVTRLSTGEATLWEKAQAAAASEAAMRVLRILKLCFANEGKQPCLYRASSSRQRVGKSRSTTDVRVFLQVPAETSQLLILADLADFPPLLLRDIRRPAQYTRRSLSVLGFTSSGVGGPKETPGFHEACMVRAGEGWATSTIPCFSCSGTKNFADSSHDCDSSKSRAPGDNENPCATRADEAKSALQQVRKCPCREPDKVNGADYRDWFPTTEDSTTPQEKKCMHPFVDGERQESS